jgi:hypothetical protein
MSGRHSEPGGPVGFRASQLRHPGHALARTMFQLVVGLAPMMPIIVAASGLPQTAAGVGVALAISAVVTRVMAIPAVEGALTIYAPWLAAEPDFDVLDDVASGDPRPDSAPE